MILLTSKGIDEIPFIEMFLGQAVTRRRWWSKPSIVAGWGRKASGLRAERFGARHGIPSWRLEDGFLRSFGTGDSFPPLSMVVDDVGIYYDSTRPSALERVIDSGADLLAGLGDGLTRARTAIIEQQLSKYNHAPPLNAAVLRSSDSARVLVVDQTFGDLSVRFGAADERTFLAMLEVAAKENPRATIYVKTHPEVASGRKRGYLTHVRDDARTVMLRDAVNPLSLIEQMDRVYVVSSTMGFEALLAGKPVTCLGIPWYAGWGATDDRAHCPRRTRARSVDELFAAAYLHYTRYLDPVTHRRGTIFDVIDWLARQRSMRFGRVASELVAGGLDCPDSASAPQRIAA